MPLLLFAWGFSQSVSSDQVLLFRKQVLIILCDKFQIYINPHRLCLCKQILPINTISSMQRRHNNRKKKRCSHLSDNLFLSFVIIHMKYKYTIYTFIPLE